jgi:hypothetical protein
MTLLCVTDFMGRFAQKIHQKVYQDTTFEGCDYFSPEFIMPVEGKVEGESN